MHEEKARLELHKNATCYFEPIIEVVPNKTVVIWSFMSDLIKPTRKMNKTCWAWFEKEAVFSYGLLHMDTLVLADQQKLTFISSVWTLDAVYGT